MADVKLVETVVKENSEILDSKKQVVAEKLQKRDEERLAEIEKRKHEKSSVTSAQESAKFFYEQFAKERNDLETKLKACEMTDREQLVEQFDALSVMHQKLQRFLTESTMFLPSYDVRQCQDILTKLQTQIQDKRDELIPKKKFAFKTKKKGTASDKPAEQIVTVSADDENVVLAECKLVDRIGEKLLMGDEINKKDVALARLDSCDVRLQGTPSAVHINKLRSCTILCGPVSGSIFIRECTNCTFVVACQQLRIHTTTNTNFYIHVTSRAIIEDCSGVLFAPYNWAYPDLKKHYEMSGLDIERNSWNDIDDFNWLANDKHSPNWDLISEKDRKTEWE